MIARYCLVGTLLLASIADATESPSDRMRCEQLTAGIPVVFHGRTLTEGPDITDPDLRRANSLLSAGCRDEALNLAKAFMATHSPDFHIAFLLARLAWTVGDTYDTDQVVNAVLREHPDFVSAQVLQASRLIEQRRLEEAATLLNSLSLRSPTDLWVYMDGLQLEARRAPSATLRDTLLEINRSAAFPPSAREVASHVGREMPNLSRDQFEAFYWADLDYESATPIACKIHSLAFLLSEDGGRYAQARDLLLSPKAQAGDCEGPTTNGVLLAQTYLMEAAHINAVPTAANASLVAKAHEILGDDWPELAHYVIGRPQFAVLEPFIAGAIAPDTKDQYGSTQICNAVALSDVAAVQTQLRAGADPNGNCEGFSLIGFIIINGGESHIEERQTILRLLRAAGGKVTAENVAICRDPANGSACEHHLLSILQP
jgi:hypothetical protein